jgi:hypothetical protein
MTQTGVMDYPKFWHSSNQSIRVLYAWVVVRSNSTLVVTRRRLQGQLNPPRARESIRQLM